MYNFWQFLHVTSAVVWVGSAILVLFLSLRLGAAKDNPIAVPAMRLLETTAVPLFILVSLSTLVTGLVMAFGWVGFGPLWIKIGLGGIAISLIMGFGYFKPLVEKLDAAVKEHGPEDSRVQALVRQNDIMSAVEVVVLLVVIWAMVAKP